jgi:hypothetical protein
LNPPARQSKKLSSPNLFKDEIRSKFGLIITLKIPDVFDVFDVSDTEMTPMNGVGKLPTTPK